MLTIQQFRERFKTNEDCLKFLIEGKWGGGYQCPKCNEYVKGRKWFYRRCRTCMYDESVTANTGLHKCKLELLKVFEIGFRISVRKKGMSTNELSKEFGCQQKTAWLIKSKFQNMMASSNNFPLENKIEIDEFLVGGI